MGYVPNLKYGKGKNTKQSPMSKMQEDHNCLRSIIIQVKNKVEEGGIPTMVMNKEVMVKPWLHLCCGDTVGLNKLCGRKATNDAYRECLCSKNEPGSPNPPCISNPDKYLITTRKSPYIPKLNRELMHYTFVQSRVHCRTFPYAILFMASITNVLEKCFMHMGMVS